MERLSSLNKLPWKCLVGNRHTNLKYIQANNINSMETIIISDSVSSEV